MCGGGGNLIGTALDVVGDVAAVATGNPEFIPLINAAVTTGTDLAEGQSIGKSLGQGAISGGEALAGQEVAGALGIGQGNTAFNSALGITGDNPAGTGLPDLGNLFSGGADSSGSTAGVSSSTGATPGGAATTTASGSPVAAGATASSSTPSSGSFTPSTDIGPEAQAAIGAQASPSGLTGTTTTASPNLGSVDSDLSATSDTAPGADTFAAVDNGAPNPANPATNFPSPQSVAPTPALPGSGGTGAVSPQAVDAALGAPAAPAATVTGSPAGAGTGGGSSPFGSYGKYAAAALPVGELAYEAIKGPGALPSNAQALEQGGAATAPLLATETGSLNAYNSGQLTGPQQANITQYIQQQQNQLIAQLAAQGVTNFAGDSRYISGMANIQQQALAQTQNYLNASLSAGLSAGGAASSNLSQVAQEQLSQNQEFQNSLTGALTSLGSIVGGSSGLNISVAK